MNEDRECGHEVCKCGMCLSLGMHLICDGRPAPKAQATEGR